MNSTKTLPKKTICHDVADHIYKSMEEKLLCVNKNELPSLAIVQVGNDEASNIYIKYKKKACEKYGFKFFHYKFDKTITTEILVIEINKINNNPEITGCIVQLPLPEHINKFTILNTVDPKKDVDCFHIENIGKLYLGIKDTKFIPATVFGIYQFIKYFKIDTKGKICVIIGKSNIVGKPLQLLLSDEFDLACTTILCDKYTDKLDELTKMADILIVAAGKHHLINNSKNIKKDCVIIDVGIHRIEKIINGNKKTFIQGDVDYENVKHMCSLITPVPGGIGPITVASLMYNLVNTIINF